MKKIILGSASERRKKILKFFSLPFKQVKSDFDESSIEIDDVEKYVKFVAKKKCEILAAKYPHEIILTADTAVKVKNRLFTKPSNEKQAYKMLFDLSNSWHEVLSGVCVYKKGEFFLDIETTRILFHPLTETQIKKYHKRFFFPDAAGGYNVTKGGSIIIKKIDGCFYNIMGLPLPTTMNLLNKAGINLWDYL